MQGTAAHLPHSILQRRAYVSCRGCVGIPPSAWGRSHEVRVAPRIKGQALFVLDRKYNSVRDFFYALMKAEEHIMQSLLTESSDEKDILIIIL